MAEFWKEPVIAWLVTIGPVERDRETRTIKGKTQTFTRRRRTVEWTPLLECYDEPFLWIQPVGDEDDDDTFFVVPCIRETYVVRCLGMENEDGLGFSSSAENMQTDPNWAVEADRWLQNHNRNDDGSRKT